jgi:hypothetical protein
MAIAVEFKQYQNEDDFVQRFLIPLFQRFGFFTVQNYHGRAEFGKDLIIGEVDRFNQVRFHGIQAKFEESISLDGTDRLVSDCKQAFGNPFRHRQTGLEERISTFYAINAGSLGPEAVQNYFNQTRPLYGGNVFLLQGQDLVVMDRWASAHREADVGAALTGLQIDLRFNDIMLEYFKRLMEAAVNASGPLPIERLRQDSISAFLQRPILPTIIPIDAAADYWKDTCSINKILDKLIFPFSSKAEDLRLALQLIDGLRRHRDRLSTGVNMALRQIGPLSQIGVWHG